MSELAYSSHPLWGQVEQIKQWSESAMFSTEAILVNEQFTFARDKVFATGAVIHSYLEQTPAILASIHGLNQIQAQLQNATNEINAFIGNANPGHIVNAANHIDQSVIPSMWSFLPRLHELPESNISEIISNLRIGANSALEGIVTQRTQLEAELEQVRTEINSERERLSSLSETLVSQKTEAMSVNARLQQEFSEHETKRASTFVEKLIEFNNRSDVDRNNVSDTAAGLIMALTKSKEDARRIVQVVGNIGTTGNFQIIANQETKQANLWRWITIGLFGLGVAVAIVTFLKFLDAPATPEHAWSAGIRLLYAIAITAPAWYAAKESARHRTNADNARQTELELASLGPFIELMPEDRKNSIRESLIEKYFGNGTKPHEVNPAGTELKDFVIDAIKASKK
jgi:hypothetical protein